MRTFDQLAELFDERGEHQEADLCRQLTRHANRIVIDPDKLLGYQIDGKLYHPNEVTIAMREG